MQQISLRRIRCPSFCEFRDDQLNSEIHPTVAVHRVGHRLQGLINEFSKVDLLVSYSFAVNVVFLLGHVLLNFELQVLGRVVLAPLLVDRVPEDAVTD